MLGTVTSSMTLSEIVRSKADDFQNPCVILHMSCIHGADYGEVLSRAPMRLPGDKLLLPQLGSSSGKAWR